MAPLPDGILPAPPDAPGSVDEDLSRPEGERWHISDPRSAEWVMRKLVRARRDLDALDHLLADYRQQLEDWRSRAGAGAERTERWANAALTAWALDQREADPEARTQILPSGTVATRWVPPRPVVTDAGAVASCLAYAQHPAFEEVVRIETRVDARRLAGVTRIADEWAVHLSCGCTAHVWQLERTLGVTVGQPWPIRVGDHDPQVHRAALDVDSVAVTGVDRARTGVLVAVIEHDDGSRHVVPIEGAHVVAGYVSASVAPT